MEIGELIRKARPFLSRPLWHIQRKTQRLTPVHSMPQVSPCALTSVPSRVTGRSSFPSTASPKSTRIQATYDVTATAIGFASAYPDCRG